MREHAGIFDLSAFAIFDVSGAGRARRAAAERARADGRRRSAGSSTRPCSRRAAASSPTSRSCGSATRSSASSRAARTGWPTASSSATSCPTTARRRLVDVTTAWTTIGLWGPRARDILVERHLRRRLARGLPVRHAAGRSRSARSSCSRRASRTSATSAGSSTCRSSRARGSGTRSGRPGSRTGSPPAGSASTGRPAGSRSATAPSAPSSRASTPSSRRAWQRPKVKEQDFVGKEAHLRHREEEPAAILCTLTVDDHTSASGVKRYPLGREPITLRDGTPLTDAKGRRSYVTSAGAAPSLGKYVLHGLPAARARGRGLDRARGRVHERALPGDRRRRRRARRSSIPRTRGSGREDPRLRQARADDGRARSCSPTTRRRSRRGTSASRSARTRSAASRRPCGSSRRTAASRSCSRSGPPRRRSSCATRWRSAIDRAIHLVTDGEEWDPQATAAAILEAIRADEAANGPFDLVFFGNESADAGSYQVGIRVAHALGRPVATGLKALVVDGGSVRCEQEAAGGRDVYVLPLPAVVTRARKGSTCRATRRCPADSARSASRSRRRTPRAPGAAAREAAARRPGGRGRSRPRCSARAPRRRPRSSRCCSEIGVLA